MRLSFAWALYSAAAILGLALLLALVVVAVLVIRRRSRRGHRSDDRSRLAGTPTREHIDAPLPPLSHAGGQIPGARKNQEDAFGFIGGQSLDPVGNHPAVVVADGMGGHAAGEVASGIVVREFINAYGFEGPPADRLRSALDLANRALGEAIGADPALHGMGTTVLAAAVTSSGLEWISVGDSPLFLFRDGKLKRLNEDHSMRPVVAAMREIDPATAERMSGHQLRSAVTGSDIAQIDASLMPELLKSGDLVVAATDGLDTLDETETAAIIAEHRCDGPEAIQEALLAAVADRNAPGQDNTTVAVIEAPVAEQAEDR